MTDEDVKRRVVEAGRALQKAGAVVSGLPNEELRAYCPAKTWTAVPTSLGQHARGRARCADCGRHLFLVGREFGKGWGRTRLPNHKPPAPAPRRKPYPFPIADANGNPVGRVTLTDAAIVAISDNYKSMVLTPVVKIGSPALDDRFELVGWNLTIMPAERKS